MRQMKSLMNENRYLRDNKHRICTMGMPTFGTGEEKRFKKIDRSVHTR